MVSAGPAPIEASARSWLGRATPVASDSPSAPSHATLERRGEAGAQGVNSRFPFNRSPISSMADSGIDEWRASIQWLTQIGQYKKAADGGPVAFHACRDQHFCDVGDLRASADATILATSSSSAPTT